MKTSERKHKMTGWERFDECFDADDGGCLYLRRVDDEFGEGVQAAGALWLDGGEDGLHYLATVAQFRIGEERYGDEQVMDYYDAAEAFSECLDGEIAKDIGWFATMDEAVQAVEDAVETYLA